MVAKGSKLSLETRRKISEATKGRTAWNKGKKLPLEQRLKISEYHKGKPSPFRGHNWGLCRKCGKDHGQNPMKGKHLSEETKREMSIIKRIQYNTVEMWRKLSEAHIGLKHSLETRLKMSLAHKGHIKSPGHRRNLSLALKGRKFTVLTRLRMSQAKHTKKFRDGVRERTMEKRKERLRKYYKIPEDIQFLPASFFEHKFTREVLINRERS